MAGTHRQWEAVREVRAVFPVKGASQQRIIVFWTVPHIVEGRICTGQAAANNAFSLNHQAARGLPGESQFGFPFVSEILIVAPVNGIRVMRPGIALSI